MPTKDNNPSLLSKVAKFVRNPTTNWTDLDKQEPEPDTGYSKQALKEMIERKRQNDFVRKREFDQLRKLRSRDPGADNPDLAGRPSYFQSSLPSNPGERAMTIKKIDEIEAQMSNQWWQGKGAGAKPPGLAATPDALDIPAAPEAAAAEAVNIGYAPTKLSPMASEAYAPTKLSPMTSGPYAPTKLSPMARDSSAADHADFMPTQTNSAFGRNALLPPTPALVAARRWGAEAGSGSASWSQDGGGFANSRSVAVELVDVVTDPDLEEAAIRFANGDNSGAETGLLTALRSGDVPRDLAQTWTSALFDLYRATGQQARFDGVAIEYAERFGRSAPTWFSMPDLLGTKSGTSLSTTVPSQLMHEPLWSSPAVFDRASVDDLQLAIANVDAPWFLDWTELDTLEPDAVEPLGALFSEWCATPVQLRFRGSDNLERALRSCTPSGDKTISPPRWRMRMDALRIMQLQDEFELAALDYCVTFEVSPPSWQDARCSFFRVSATTLAALNRDMDMPDAAEMPADPVDGDNQGHTVPMGLDSTPAAVAELSGEILGEATEALDRLEAARLGADRLVISCANLIRVDFSAAGSILNWVALRQSEGCHLQFRNVHRLVATFFNVIGINEHARVVLRSN